VDLTLQQVPDTNVWNASYGASEEPALIYHPLAPTHNNGYLYLPDPQGEPLLLVNNATGQETYGAGKVAFVRLPDAIPNAMTDEKSHDVVVSYTASAQDTVANVERQKLTLGLELEKAHPYGYWAVRNDESGEPSATINQVYVPVYQQLGTDGNYLGTSRGPYEMLLFTLLSTGTPGYNHAVYDQLPAGWGLGIQAAFVDVQSFLDADYAVCGSDLSQRKAYVIDESVAWSELLAREAKLFGWGVVWRDGKLRCARILAPNVGSWTVELSDSTRATRDERHLLDISADTVVNQWSITTYRHGEEQKPITVTDADSVQGIGETKTIDVDHPGVSVGIGDRLALAESFKSLILDSPSILRYPGATVEVGLAPTLAAKVWPGDVVLFTSSYFPDPLGTGTMSTSIYALVTRTSWDYRRWIGSAQLFLLTRAGGAVGRAWAPSALVNYGHDTDGYDFVGQKVYLSPVWFGQSTTDDDDGMRFLSGYKVLLIDRCPSNQNAVTVAGPFTLQGDYSNSGKYITLDTNWSTYNAVKEYIVAFDDWASCPANQRLHGVWQANVLTDLLSDGTKAPRWG
jgi:hypothetical protein